MKALSLVAALTAAAACPLAAPQPAAHRPAPAPAHQNRMQGHMGMMMAGMDSMMAPMMKVLAYSPARLLDEKTTLHLTTNQVSELTTLNDAAKATHEAAAQQAAMHLREMESVMQVATPDTAAARPHFDAAHRFMADAMWAMVRSAAQARALLTDAQRKQVDEMPAMRGGMMQH